MKRIAALLLCIVLMLTLTACDPGMTHLDKSELENKVVKVEIFVDRQIKIVKRRRILHKKILNQGERKQPIEKNRSGNPVHHPDADSDGL